MSTRDAKISNTAPHSQGSQCPQGPQDPHCEFLRLCLLWNIIGFTFEKIGTRINAKGERKKAPAKFPVWSNVTRDNYTKFVNRRHKAFAFITGKLSDVTMVDCDSMEAYERIITNYPEIKDTLTVKTRQGAHLYFRYVRGLVTSEKSFKNDLEADIRNDEGLGFAPPTVYDFFGERASYEVVNENAKILEMPKGLIGDVKDRYKAGAGITKTGVKSKAKAKAASSSVQLATSTSSASSTSSALIVAPEATAPAPAAIIEMESARSSLMQSIRDQVAMLPQDYLDSWKSWARLGAIIHHELGDTHGAKKLFLELSKRSSTYSNEVQMSDIERVWKTYSDRKAKIVTIASLFADVNNENQLSDCAFLESSDEELDNDGLVRDKAEPAPTSSGFDFGLITTTNLAQYFVKRHAGDFIQCVCSDDQTSGLWLVWWDAKACIWNRVLARQQMLRLIGNELFFGLQQLAVDTITNEKYRAIVLKGLVQLQDRSFKEKVMNDVLTAMEMQSIEFDINAEQYNNLQFRNGVLMLDHVSIGPNGEADTSCAFRQREKSDYVTKTLDWDFGVAIPAAVSKVEEIFSQIQPRPEQRKLQLGYLAYSLTGNTDAQTFKINVGYSASNGKSCECQIHDACFGLYTMKLHKGTFNEGNQKAHKFLIGLISDPIRYAYIEELDRRKLDADMLKDFVSGGKITVEVMYGTSITRPTQAKLATNSNKDINVDMDEGVLRRGMMQTYDSKFVLTPLGNVNPPQFKKIEGLHKMFHEEGYRRAYLHVLLPHVVSYYRNGLFKPASAVNDFATVVGEYDAFKNALMDVCEVGSESDRIWKEDLVEALRGSLSRGLSWVKILPEIKRLGYVYRDQERARRRNGDGGTCKGAIVGLRWTQS